MRLLSRANLSLEAFESDVFEIVSRTDHPRQALSRLRMDWTKIAARKQWTRPELLDVDFGEVAVLEDKVIKPHPQLGLSRDRARSKELPLVGRCTREQLNGFDALLGFHQNSDVDAVASIFITGEMSFPASMLQVSRVGNRSVPLHVAGMGEAHTHVPPLVRPSRNEMLRKLNPQPRCEIYEEWLSRKEFLLEEALNRMTLRDLQRIHKHLAAGQLAVSLQWNAIAQRKSFSKYRVPTLEQSTIHILESDASLQKLRVLSGLDNKQLRRGTDLMPQKDRQGRRGTKDAGKLRHRGSEWVEVRLRKDIPDEVRQAKRGSEVQQRPEK